MYEGQHIMSMEKYLGEDKAKRYAELNSKKFSDLTKEEHEERYAFISEVVDKKEALGEFKLEPFEGKCRRCGREFDNPVPEVTYPKGSHEVACAEWCADCNAFVMNIVYREFTAYMRKKGSLYDPVRGGSHANS